MDENTPAGWHPDPSGAPQLRFWDGTAWTTETKPYPAPESPPSLAAVSEGSPQVGTAGEAQAVAPARIETERSSRKWIIWAVAGVVVVLAAVGFQVANRHSIDEASRDAARRGANIGGPANPEQTMYDILCPDGPASDVPPGVNCDR